MLSTVPLTVQDGKSGSMGLRVNLEFYSSETCSDKEGGFDQPNMIFPAPMKRTLKLSSP